MRNLPWDKPGRFWKGNLHCHSDASDGVMSLDRVVHAYRHQGYDFLAVTEHFNGPHAAPIADTRRFCDDSFTTLLGAELEAPGSAIGEPWWILALGLPLDFAPVAPNETLPAIAARCREVGAFVAAAAPYWSGITHEDVLRLEAAHAVETWNETCAVGLDRGDSWHLLDAALARGRRLLGLAVDDAHFRSFWPDHFAAWVMVRSEVLEPDALLAALKAGHYYGTQGPAIHHLSTEGGALRVTCSPARAVLASGRGYPAEVVHGTAVTKAELPLDKFFDSWCRVTVVGTDGRRAWSNPIWLDPGRQERSVAASSLRG